MDFGALIGPAVVAAGVSGIISVVGLIVSTRTARALHSEKLAFDRDLAERKFAFDSKLAERKLTSDHDLAEWKAQSDVHLAENKFKLDTAFADRKRRQDLAEEVLSSFYQMVDTIRAIRSSFGYAGEGEERQKQPNESPEVARARDAYYAIIERFEQRRKEMADLLTRRYRMSAWFGKEAEEPFNLIQGALNEIIVSARNLTAWEGEPGMSLPDNRRLIEKMRGDIWEGVSTPDLIGEKVTRSIALIESICRPVLQERAK